MKINQIIKSKLKQYGFNTKEELYDFIYEYKDIYSNKFYTENECKFCGSKTDGYFCNSKCKKEWINLCRIKNTCHYKRWLRKKHREVCKLKKQLDFLFYNIKLVKIINGGN